MTSTTSVRSSWSGQDSIVGRGSSGWAKHALLNTYERAMRRSINRECSVKNPAVQAKAAGAVDTRTVAAGEQGLQTIVRPYVPESTYFAHPELLLLTRLSPPDQENGLTQWKSSASGRGR